METDTRTETKEQNNMKRTSSSTCNSQTHSPQQFHSPLRSEPAESPPYASPAASPLKVSPVGSLEKSSPLGSPEKPSPRRSPDSLSPLGSPENPPLIDECKAIVKVGKSTQFSPSPSPSPPHSVEDTEAAEEESKSPPKNTPAAEKSKSPPKYTVEKPNEPKYPLANSAVAVAVAVAVDGEKSSPPTMLFNRSVKEDVTRVATKKMTSSVNDRSGAVAAILRRTRRDELMKLGALGFRLSEVILSLISFAVMSADKTQGWSGDSYDRYKEYRYCLSVNVIAFVYSGFQAYDLGYYLLKEKHLIHHYLRPLFDFFMDQVLAYLLISSSSAAATRIDDWVSNWGKDEFTVMASASVAMSFLAFVAFAFSSLISGYDLCTRESIR